MLSGEECRSQSQLDDGEKTAIPDSSTTPALELNTNEVVSKLTDLDVNTEIIE
jgi:hypothetical protein